MKTYINCVTEALINFCLTLRKVVYHYECIDSWKKFDRAKLPTKEEFYCNLNTEDITDADFKHVKRVWRDFELRNLGYYHDLHVQSDTGRWLLLTDVLENFQNKRVETFHQLDPAYFLSAPGLVW